MTSSCEIYIKSKKEIIYKVPISRDYMREGVVDMDFV